MRKSTFFISLSTTVITVSLFIFLAACHKNKTPAPEDTGYATDQANSEQTFNDVENIANQAATVGSGSLGYRTTATTGTGCATVTHSGDSIIIDFGTSDCTCHDGRKRRGTIIVIYTGGNYGDSGSVHTITFDNFYQNDNKVTGSKTVTNMGHNALGQPFFNVTIVGALTMDGGGTISVNWTRVRTWTAGYDTPTDFTDDVYSITGSGTLVRANGMQVSINISVPLIVATSCHWIEAGSVVYGLPGGATRTLNFGNTPVCDDLATITLGNGTVRDITLP